MGSSDSLVAGKAWVTCQGASSSTDPAEGSGLSTPVAGHIGLAGPAPLDSGSAEHNLSDPHSSYPVSRRG